MIVAGEASADRYAARLVEAIRRGWEGDKLRFFGTGGDRMQAAGVDLCRHLRDLASIGPLEAVSHLGTYLATYRDLVAMTRRFEPDVAVLLDFPEFNLRLARRLKHLGIPVVYYIGPQLWAWRRGRIRIVRSTVDRMLVILPFEEEYYRRRGVAAQFVGHPLLEEFKPRADRLEFLRRHALSADRTTIAVLPGSRRREVEYILPVLVEAGLALGEFLPAQFAVSAAPTVDGGRIREIVGRSIAGRSGGQWFRVVDDESRNILANADFGWVKSGTSTLEAALVGIPFLMVYRVSRLSGMIGKLLIRSRFKGLVNLIAQQEVIPELLQSDARPEKVARLTRELLAAPPRLAEMRRQLESVRQRLGRQAASETVAGIVRSYLGNRNK